MCDAYCSQTKTLKFLIVVFYTAIQYSSHCSSVINALQMKGSMSTPVVECLRTSSSSGENYRMQLVCSGQCFFLLSVFELCRRLC